MHPTQRLSRPTPPRGLIFLAFAWLLLSWGMTLGIRPPVQAHAASYMPGVRDMLLLMVAGVGIAWPLARLSGPWRAWPIRQSLLDLTVLLCLAQVVVWPLRLVTTWPAWRSASIDLCFCGWALAAAAAVATGTIPARRGTSVLRTGSMIAAVLFVGGAPLFTLLSGGQLPFAVRPSPADDPSWWTIASFSPLTAMNLLTGGGAINPSSEEWGLALVGWWVAIAAWIVAFAVGAVVPRVDGRKARHTRDAESDPAEPPPLDASAGE